MLYACFLSILESQQVVKLPMRSLISSLYLPDFRNLFADRSTALSTQSVASPLSFRRGDSHVLPLP